MSECLGRRGHDGNGSGLTLWPEDAGGSCVLVQSGYGESLAFSGVQIATEGKVLWKMWEWIGRHQP